jgi:hypothetical protein
LIPGKRRKEGIADRVGKAIAASIRWKARAPADLAPPFGVAAYSPLLRICGKLTTPR